MNAARTALAVAVLLLTGCEDRADLTDITFKVRTDIRYATTSNFMHRALYPEPRCLLRESTAQKLLAADKELRGSGLALKVFDCYRPLSVQRLMWEIVPDERYVANPAKGSRHNRGAAVDLTLVDAVSGAELWMPTPYDEFTESAHRSFSALPPEPIANRKRLEDLMTRHGFVGLPTEWWHFDDTDWESSAVLDIAFASVSKPKKSSGTRP